MNYLYILDITTRTAEYIARVDGGVTVALQNSLLPSKVLCLSKDPVFAEQKIVLLGQRFTVIETNNPW